MRMAVNAMWIANSVIIMILLANQKDEDGNLVDCFAVEGIARPYMVNTSWELYMT